MITLNFGKLFFLFFCHGWIEQKKGKQKQKKYLGLNVIKSTYVTVKNAIV